MKCMFMKKTCCSLVNCYIFATLTKHYNMYDYQNKEETDLTG